MHTKNRHSPLPWQRRRGSLQTGIQKRRTHDAVGIGRCPEPDRIESEPERCHSCARDRQHREKLRAESHAALPQFFKVCRNLDGFHRRVRASASVIAAQLEFSANGVPESKRTSPVACKVQSSRSLAEAAGWETMRNDPGGLDSFVNPIWTRRLFFGEAKSLFNAE